MIIKLFPTFQNWVGDVTTTDNMDFKIENTKMKIEPGPAQAVRFFAQYNQLNKVPRLRAIRLNGREICNANTPRPTIDVTGTQSHQENHQNDFSARPTERPRPDLTTGQNPTSRPQTVDRPSGSSRPVTVRPDRQTDGPVYRPTQNPPVDQSQVHPYSM